MEAETADGLEMIISSVESAKEAEFKVSFDPTLVRGMSYYTERFLRFPWMNSAVL
mgnify:CR=1 FL=1